MQYFLQFAEAQEEKPEQTSCPYLSQFVSWLTQGGGVVGVLPFIQRNLIFISSTDARTQNPKHTSRANVKNVINEVKTYKTVGSGITIKKMFDFFMQAFIF